MYIYSADFLRSKQSQRRYLLKMFKSISENLSLKAAGKLTKAEAVIMLSTGSIIPGEGLQIGPMAKLRGPEVAAGRKK